MAELVAVIASTHHPFYYRASTATGEDRPDFADEWVRKIEAFRETLTRARPDVLGRSSRRTCCGRVWTRFDLAFSNELRSGSSPSRGRRDSGSP